MSLSNFFRSFKKSKDPNRALEAIGGTAVVVERVDDMAGCGLVAYKDCRWAARTVDGDGVADVGERLTVVAVEGVRLICRRQ